jgi:hypothetical protein
VNARPPTTPRGRPALRLHVELRRRPGDGPAHWEADVSGPSLGRGLHFDGMAQLVRYLLELDATRAPGPGIR